MIIGIGHDIIEVSRIEKAIQREPFLKKVFTSNEITHCQNKANAAQSFAARFAAKEAFFKAIGTGWAEGLQWIDIEILNDDKGKPTINCFGETKKRIADLKIHISLSHLKDIASATIIIEE